MKKILLIITASFMTGVCAHAQSLWDISKPNQDFTFGVRAGVNFASTDMDYANSTRTGFHLGASVDWNIVKSFSVTSGLYYTTKGFKSSYGKGSAGYLQIPLLASYRIETPTGVQFHFNVGPYFALGVNGSVQYKPYDATFVYDFDQDSFGNNGFFKRFDAGLSAGAYILIGRLSWGVGYELGFVDFAKAYGKFHNRNVTTTLGFNF